MIEVLSRGKASAKFVASHLIRSALRIPRPPAPTRSERGRWCFQKRIRPVRGQEPQLRRIGRRQAVDRLHSDGGQTQPPCEQTTSVAIRSSSGYAVNASAAFSSKMPASRPGWSCAAA